MITRLILAATLALAACAASPQPPQNTARTNPATAADFLELNFRMESGREIPHFTRFEGPIRVAMTGPIPPSAAPDLAKVLARLRSEAGLDIRSAPLPPAHVGSEFLPRATMRATVPDAACFVVPNAKSWAEFRAQRGTASLDWTQLKTRSHSTIFIPTDVAPQEIRDCLHEELAQSLGPLNDLYHLSDSVFNDDNFHTQLTKTDMLFLRMAYAPELRSGMTQAEVAAILPALLQRLNPKGGTGPTQSPRQTPRSFAVSIEGALTGANTLEARRASAKSALAQAHRNGWHDNRLAFAHFLTARLSDKQNPKVALAHYDQAAAIYGSLPTGALHLAHVDLQRANIALTNRDLAQVLALTARAKPAALAHESTPLLAILAMLRSESLTALGQAAEARAARLDSLAWGRYAFGSEDKALARLTEVSSPKR